MKGFKYAMADIRNTLNKLIIFDTTINAILTFLVLLLVLSLFSLPITYPAAIALVYFVFVLRRRLKSSKIRLVEQKYQSLNEKLRTAAEFADTDNPVVHELHTEVIRDLKKVDESAFFNEKKIYLKSIVIVVLCFAILLLSPVTFGILDFNFNLADTPTPEAEGSPSGSSSGDSKIKFAVGPEDTGLRKASDDIYGEPTIAQLGDDEIKIKITPAGTELSIREIQEADFPDFSESYPLEIQASAAESYEETIPKEDLELVKNYFNTLAQN